MEHPRIRPVAGHRPQSGVGPERASGQSRRPASLATCGIVGLLVSLCGCRAPVPSPAPSPASGPVRMPSTATQRVPAASWQIDEASSEIVVLAFREGALAKLGHNHVLQFGSLSGSAAEGADGVAFTVALPLAGILLDDPGQRGREGAEFDMRPTTADIEGTRRNLLGERVLDAAAQAEIRVAGRCAAPCLGNAAVDIVIGISGRETRHMLGVVARRDGDVVTVTGEWMLEQSTLGLVPFSVALGSLRVRDALQVRGRLVFRRAG